MMIKVVFLGGHRGYGPLLPVPPANFPTGSAGQHEASLPIDENRYKPCDKADNHAAKPTIGTLSLSHTKCRNKYHKDRWFSAWYGGESLLAWGG